MNSCNNYGDDTAGSSSAVIPRVKNSKKISLTSESYQTHQLAKKRSLALLDFSSDLIDLNKQIM